MARLGTETAFDVMVKAKALEAQGKEMIHLEIGEPDFITPANIIQAAIEALNQGYTHYCPSAGLPELRAAIAEEIRVSRGVPVNPDWVVVTPGGKPIMFYLIMALVEEGDEAIYPNPGYPIYESMINYMGGTAVPLPLYEKHGFRFEAEELRSRVSSKTRLLVLNSPQNPTGGLLTPEDFQVIAELACRYDFMVLADEIYSKILYEGTHSSIAALPGMLERTIILDGFSKTYAMTGWRMGYGVMPPELAKHVARLVTNSVSCTPPFVQRAGLAAFSGAGEASAAMVAEFRRRRDFLVEALNQIPGVRCFKPNGAFYVFPNVQSFGRPSSELADYIMQEAGVAVLSGTCFGEYGEGYIRLSYANSLENLEKAVEKIRRALARL
jgi:aspartate/methionine/tyrosine aminotransferase